MTRHSLQRIVVAGFALVLLLGPLAPALASQSSNDYHWARKSTPFTLKIGENVDGGWDKRIKRAISDWNENDTVVLKAVSGSTTAKNCDQTKGMVEVCNFNYGTQEGWLGLTRLYFDKSRQHIEAATLQLNDSYFNQRGGQYNSEAARQHTICHELGHTMGLGHVNTKSCMNDSQSAVFNNLTPINKDFRKLAKMYDHKDSTTTVSGNQKAKDSGQKSAGNDEKKASSKKNQDRKDAARERRRELKHRNKNHASSEGFFDPTTLPTVPGGLDSNETVTVQTLDDGTAVVTFITWADDAAPGQ
ncbi:MAG: hypothetical protein U0031_05875 [Thermomicrobiales bacterium]